MIAINTDREPQPFEEWPARVDESYIQGRMCRLASLVWHKLDPHAQTANDCFCGRAAYLFHDYRNEGLAIQWIESAVKACIGMADPIAEVAKLKGGAK